MSPGIRKEVAASTIAFVALTVAVAQRLRPLEGLDHSISAAGHRFTLAHSLWRSLMFGLTHTADSVVQVIVFLVVLLLLGWWRRWADIAYVLVTVAAIEATRSLVLALIHRPRPGPEIGVGLGWSYPSGHATSSATLALLVITFALAGPTVGRARKLVVIAALVWTALVGLSRVMLTVHWPSDVLGSWLLVAMIGTSISTGPLGPARASRGEVRPEVRESDR